MISPAMARDTPALVDFFERSQGFGFGDICFDGLTRDDAKAIAFAFAEGRRTERMTPRTIVNRAVDLADIGETYEAAGFDPGEIHPQDAAEIDRCAELIAGGARELFVHGARFVHWPSGGVPVPSAFRDTIPNGDNAVNDYRIGDQVHAPLNEAARRRLVEARERRERQHARRIVLGFAIAAALAYIVAEMLP